MVAIEWLPIHACGCPWLCFFSEQTRLLDKRGRRLSIAWRFAFVFKRRAWLVMVLCGLALHGGPQVRWQSLTQLACCGNRVVLRNSTKAQHGPGVTVAFCFSFLHLMLRAHCTHGRMPCMNGSGLGCLEPLVGHAVVPLFSNGIWV